MPAVMTTVESEVFVIVSVLVCTDPAAAENNHVLSTVEIVNLHCAYDDPEVKNDSEHISISNAVARMKEVR